MATDTEHTAREDVGRPTDQRHTGQRSSEKLHPTARHVHFYQCCGHHKHNQDHQEREHYPHLRGKPERNTEVSVKDVWVGTVDGIVSEESSTFASFLRGHKLRNLNSVDILTYKTSLCYKKKHSVSFRTQNVLVKARYTSNEIEERTDLTSFRTKSGQNQVHFEFVSAVRNSSPKQTFWGSFVLLQNTVELALVCGGNRWVCSGAQPSLMRNFFVLGSFLIQPRSGRRTSPSH